MYSVDERDRVIELEDVPQSCVGAPMPVVLSDEHRVLLGYVIQDTGSADDGDDSHEQFAIIDLAVYSAYMFGSPNDEAFAGHPLASRGLRPYGSFQIEDSSWIRQLERMNTVHPYHKPERFDRLKHFVFSFHDSTFECVAEGFTVWPYSGSLDSLILTMRERLWTDIPFCEGRLIF
jgi:hypothetical protein